VLSLRALSQTSDPKITADANPRKADWARYPGEHPFFSK
jgi:hypothetical protein